MPLVVKIISSIKHILQGIHYLHSQSRSITHGHLSVETVFVKREPLTQSWILKIGDFSQAKVWEALTETTDNEAPVITLSLRSASPWLMVGEMLIALQAYHFFQVLLLT